MDNMEWDNYTRMMNTFVRYIEYYGRGINNKTNVMLMRNEHYSTLETNSDLSETTGNILKTTKKIDEIARDIHDNECRTIRKLNRYRKVKTSNSVESDDVDSLDEEWKKFVAEGMKHRIKHKMAKKKEDNGKLTPAVETEKNKKDEAERLYGKNYAGFILGMEAELQLDYIHYCDNFDPRVIEVCFGQKMRRD